MTIYVPGPCGVCSVALPPPRCSLSFQPFIFHLLFLFPPWSLKAIIISLQTCRNPTLKLYLEEPYWDEWNSSPTDEWLSPANPELSDIGALSNKRRISLHFKYS